MLVFCALKFLAEIYIKSNVIPQNYEGLLFSLLVFKPIFNRYLTVFTPRDFTIFLGNGNEYQNQIELNLGENKLFSLKYGFYQIFFIETNRALVELYLLR